MGTRFFFSLTFVVLALTASAEAPPSAVRMNEVQVIGTHNSYHVAPALSVSRVTDWVARVKDLNYTHAPLDVQLDRGVRSFEIDLHHTAEGFAVFHVPLIDEGSTCRWFTECLALVRAWSETHPGHVPISFLLEFKDENVRPNSRLLPLGAQGLDRLDADILSVFPRERVITPDDVRGDAQTLEAAVLNRGWPTMDEARGKVFFILHERRENRDLYTEGRPSLEGRVMFVNSSPGRPDAATLVLDHPDVGRIAPLAAQGYLIRTRADAGLRVSETRRDTALASGAHILSTDFPPGQPHESGYVMAFPGGAPARCNPVNAPETCADTLLEASGETNGGS